MKQKILNFTVLIEQDKDGMCVAKVPYIPGCATQGKTLAEVIERVKETIQVCIESKKLMKNKDFMASYRKSKEQIKDRDFADWTTL